jgi:fumarylacetoacetase
MPYGVFSRGGSDRKIGVRVDDSIIDLGALAEPGLLGDIIVDPAAVLVADTLMPLLRLGKEVWSELRARLHEILSSVPSCRQLEECLVSVHDVELHLPLAPQHFVDFYSSLYHAESAGRIVRPAAPPLPANWRSIPLGYHGHPGNIELSGTSVHRPHGQVFSSVDDGPRFVATRLMDFELEVGFVTGSVEGPVTTDDTFDHIFGVVMLNDWSARDVQRFENPPLGPFAAKSFATTISAWVTPLDALQHCRTAAPPQDPPALPHLRRRPDAAFDITLEAHLVRRGVQYQLTKTNLKHLYWTMDQQLAHVVSNGARFAAGDLFGTGTVSGPSPESAGSLLELTWDGSNPLVLDDDDELAYLEDGDEIVLSGHVESTPGHRGFRLGEARGCVVPARTFPGDSQ